MSYSIWFLVILILVSGFIAYWGDLLGRRMGKRRLTLFNLRPKHTAIIVTTITGMAIAGLTLGTMLLMDRQLRELLVRGNEIIRDNRQLTNRNATLRADMRDLEKRHEVLTDRMDETLTDMQSANDAAAEAKRMEMAAQEKAGDLEAQVSRWLRELEAVKNQHADTTRQLKTEKAKLASTTSDLLTAEKSLQNAERILLPLHQQLYSYQAGYDRMIKGAVIVQQGEEIIRRVISSSNQARQELEALLDDAGKVVLEKGAVEGENGRAVIVAPTLVTTTDAKGQKKSVWVTESNAIAGIARNIVESSEDVVVLVVALRNCVDGEQTPVRLVSYKNKTVFMQGDYIASATMDGTATEVQIINDLVKFLQTDVRKVARQAGVIPVFDPDDPEAMFGTISGSQADEFMDVVSRIKAADDTVTVRIIAREEIRAAGPMNLSNLEFIVTSVTGAASES